MRVRCGASVRNLHRPHQATVLVKESDEALLCSTLEAVALNRETGRGVLDLTSVFQRRSANFCIRYDALNHISSLFTRKAVMRAFKQIL